jgi:outer membrane protein TolC
MNTMKRKNLIIMAVISTAFFSVVLYGQNNGKTIEECLEIAFKNNPELKSQEMKIEEAKAKYNQQIGNLLPQIDTNLSYYRYEKELPSKKILIGESLDDYYADISLRQILFSGGKYVSRIDSAKFSLIAETYKYEQIKRQVILSVEKAYYGLLQTIHTLKIQNELLKRLKEQLQVTKLLYSSGKISNLDVLKVETQVALSEDMVSNLQNLVYTKSLLLAQSMGVKEPVTVQDNFPEIKENIKVNTLCLENNFKDNPELNYIKSLQEKAKYDIDESKSNLYPSIYLKTNYNIETNRVFSPHTLWSDWYIGVGLTFSLYDGGNIASQIKQAESKYEQISETVRQIEINIKTRFESARATFIDRKSRLKTTKKVLDLAKETLTTAELKYNSGKLSAIELIDAQMLWNNAEINYINNVVDYLNAVAEIKSICPNAIIEGGK